MFRVWGLEKDRRRGEGAMGRLEIKNTDTKEKRKEEKEKEKEW